MRIHRLRGLIAYSYIIETDDGLYLVDAGTPRHARAILGKIGDLGRTPEELRLAVVTHAHLDHFGGLASVQRAAGGFDVVTHPEHAETVATGGILVSPGLNPFSKIYELIAKAYLPTHKPHGVEQVVPLEDGARLDAWGLGARIVHTPGHSAGDISLLLDDGTAFVGDTIQGRRISRLTPPEMPNMALDTHAVLESWASLLAAGAERILPAHGSALTADEIRPVLARETARHSHEFANKAGRAHA